MKKNISLYEFQTLIRYAIDKNVKSQWITAEISEIKENSAGHCYLELVEKGDNQSAIPKAKASAVIWRSTYQLLRPYFYEQTGQHLKSGIKVLMYVTASFHELYGLSLVVKDIDPTYTLGELEMSKQKTIAQLVEDGVFEMNKDISLPTVIERIAVVSSQTAAGYEDFVRHIKENEYGYTFHTTLFPAMVQGEQAEQSIINALYNIADRADDFDCVVIIRGGGSQSDMACFNNYGLCSCIAQFPLAIIAGIGHNKDVSVADMVAHRSVKTPTAAANMLIDIKREFEDTIDEVFSDIIEIYNTSIKNENERIATFLMQIKLLTKESVHAEQIKLNALSSDIRMLTKELISGENVFLDEVLRDILRSCKNTTSLNIDKLNRYQELLSNRSEMLLMKQNQRVDLLKARCDAYDPKHILKLGFSIVTVGGKAIKSVKDVTSGEVVVVKMADGEINTEVKNRTIYGKENK